ncbi:hypothetical protein BC828DRAFT_378627 [Blastocladiella britannica]|nr:hypothetical protein BC828DRAFT_378627 [Blastocladiella britannica]
MIVDFGDAVLRDYDETKKLRSKLAEAEQVAMVLVGEMHAQNRTILELQGKLRTKIFTHLCDLSVEDLAPPDDTVIHGASAAGLYSLTPESLVVLVLKKEATVQALVRRVFALKRERDNWMLRSSELERALGRPKDPEWCHDPPVRQGVHMDIAQWVFADRSSEGIARATNRIVLATSEAAAREVAPLKPLKYSHKDRMQAWTADPVDCLPHPVVTPAAMVDDDSGRCRVGSWQFSASEDDEVDNNVDANTHLRRQCLAKTLAAPVMAAVGQEGDLGPEKPVPRRPRTASSSLRHPHGNSVVEKDDDDVVDPAFWLPDGPTNSTAISANSLINLHPDAKLPGTVGPRSLVKLRKELQDRSLANQDLVDALVNEKRARQAEKQQDAAHIRALAMTVQRCRREGLAGI